MPGFIFKSTGVIMRLLEKLLNSNITVKGIENIPDTPVLFVANHFTRSETFILPYVIHSLTKKKVCSLADNKVFVGALGKYLRSMGTISVSDPNRNRIILGNLITGKRDWLIYPEGIMLKNKHIIRKRGLFIDNGKEIQRIYTGSAVLALQAELLKEEFIMAQDQQDYETMRNISQEYFIASDENINPKPLHVVPVTVNFFPMRPGKNSIYNVAKRFIKDPNSRIAEEVEIEGRLLTDAQILLHFDKPINIYQYIKQKRRLIQKIPFISTQSKNKLILNYFRQRLTNQFMKQIYDNIYVNFDHIFALSIYYYQDEYISENHLKNLIYINARMIKHLKKYNLHEAILGEISFLLRAEPNKYYNSIIDLGLAQNILTKSRDGFMINHKKLNATPDFHKDRLHNSFKIFINELQQFPDIINICSKHAKLSDAELKEAVFNELLFYDDKEYRIDYSKYFSKSESKPRDYGHPRFLEAKDSKVGIILSHGYKSSPKEVEELGIYLNQAGFNVYMVRLKGHGTAPQNLKNIKWEEWYNSFSVGYMILKQKCSHIVAAGFSTGGLLALLMAARSKNDICAVVSINAALKLNDIRVNLVPTINYWNEFLTLIHSKKGKKEYIIDKPENPDINYSKNYLKAVEQLSQLMAECADNLKNIIAPTLVVQATNDPVVNPKSGKIIYKNISAKIKEILSPNLNNHVIIRRRDEKLFSHITNFIKENCLNNSNEHK